MKIKSQKLSEEKVKEISNWNYKIVEIKHKKIPEGYGEFYVMKY